MYVDWCWVNNWVKVFQNVKCCIYLEFLGRHLLKKIKVRKSRTCLQIVFVRVCACISVLIKIIWNYSQISGRVCGFFPQFDFIGLTAISVLLLSYACVHSIFHRIRSRRGILHFHSDNTYILLHNLLANLLEILAELRGTFGWFGWISAF